MTLSIICRVEIIPRCHFFKSSDAHRNIIHLSRLTQSTNHYFRKWSSKSSIIISRRPIANQHEHYFVRCFSTQQDLDFFIPPLDLTTPSFSIPLPPNMMINELDPKLDSSEQPPLRIDHTSDQPSSFLSDSIVNMRKSLELDGQLASKYRAQILSELQNNDQQRDAVIPDTSSSHDDRNALLSSIKVEINKHIDVMWPRYRSRNPPKITDRKMRSCQRTLQKNIQRIENEFINSNQSNEENGRLVKLLGYEMRDLRALEEYGITPTQFSRIKKSLDWKDYKNRSMILRELQMVYYGKKSTVRSRSRSMAVRRGEKTQLLHGASSETSSTAKEVSSDEVMEPVKTKPSLAVFASKRKRRNSRSKYPATEFIRNLINTQADGTILGRSGATSVLCTVILDTASSYQSSSLVLRDAETKDGRNQQTIAESVLQSAIDRANAQSGAAFIPLQVDFRQRYHAIGKIPLNKRRRDNSGPLSDEEILAARVIDRSVRPWLLLGLASSSSDMTQRLPDSIVVSCEVQSYDPRPCNEECGQGTAQRRTHSDPTVLAVNSAIASLYYAAYSSSTSPNFPIPSDAAACVKLAILWDGTCIIDPTPKELQECKFELLYAGTKDRALMLEFSSNAVPPKSKDIGDLSAVDGPGIPESTVADAIQLAHENILPMIEMQEKLRDDYIKEIKSLALENDEALCSDEEIAQLLGFESQIRSLEETDKSGAIRPLGMESGIAILDEANSFVWSKVERGARKLFGQIELEDAPSALTHEITACIHEGAALLPKQVRGRRENIIQSEIARILRDEFVPHDKELATFYRLAIESSTCLNSLSGHIHECIMKKAMSECAKRNFRADGRLGVNVVRPISAVAPILPDSVHGSALFSRGETQVMCTVTLGAPREGLPIIGPYAPSGDFSDSTKDRGDDDKVPVGSLRFLRNQAELESDFNTRRVLAGREMTGDSGIFSEVKRAFLHYDFPDFSTGVVRAKTGASANRRAIGHGNLAEKAILPVLPHLNDFPYTIRMTSEVTSSNGSSSMASACGSSLALLDAGVPLISPVAGVSVGLAPGTADDLLLDITGTEDHYGDMDFKICGTYDGITAMQLDVKRPLKTATITNALYLAREGRRAILRAMEHECTSTLPGLEPRASLKLTAPRVEIVRFDPNRKRDLIGPGGSVLRQLEDRFAVTLDLSQDGQCLIFGPHSSVLNARNVIMDLVSEVEEGGIYEGTVVEIKDFGAIVELLRNKEGLLHVSELSDTIDKHPGGNLGVVKEHLKVGDKIEVLCTKIDHVQGSIKLSRKGLLRRQSKLK